MNEIKEVRMASSSNRIDWIDIAKGIAIILEIIGHTVKFGSGIRNFIFSFHMPLFFILSGYTFHVAESKEYLSRHFHNNLKHLLLPVLVIVFLKVFFSWLFQSDNSFNECARLVIHYADALFWSSGVRVKSHPGLGAPWFLVSLFGAKLLLDIIRLIFKSEWNYIVPAVALIGISLSLKGKWLPLNFDVTMGVILFLHMGILWKRFDYLLSRYRGQLFCIALIIWATCLYFGMYIELATRKYPYLFLSIIEGIFGTIIVCNICYALSIQESSHIFLKS